MSEIKVVELYNIDNQPINEQEQPATDKNMNLVGQNYVPPSVPGATTPQETGMGIARNAVLNIGSLTEYILIDGVGRVIKSSNYVPGVSGWAIKSDGSVEFSNGVFRGDITGASGTFSGTVTGTIANLGGFIVGATTIRDNADSFGLSSAVTGGNDVRFWAGTSTANMASAPVRIYEDGLIVASNIEATGAINATSGWIGSPTALVYESQGINTGTTGYIRGGQTAFNTGTGYFLGYYSGGYKLSIGESATGKSLLWDGLELTVNGSPVANQDIYGDGSDGDVTISGDTSLSADAFYNNLTINNGVTLNPNGYRIFVKRILTNNGTISRKGNNGENGGSTYNGGGSGGAGGTALAAGSLYGSYAGGEGGAAGSPGGAGSNSDKTIGTYNGVRGGSGGDTPGANDPTLHNEGNGGTITGTIINKPHNALFATLLYDISPSYVQFKPSPASGGGGGGYPSFNCYVAKGGGAGTSGGVMAIYAHKIINNGLITVKGGNGGSGSYGSGWAGPSGGGGGGNGGALVLVYSKKEGNGTIDYSGGTGGSPGGYGATSGQTGNNGTLIELQVWNFITITWGTLKCTPMKI